MSRLTKLEQTLIAEGMDRVELGRRYDAPEIAIVPNRSEYPLYLGLGHTLVKMEVEEQDRFDEVTFSIFPGDLEQQAGSFMPDLSLTLPSHAGSHFWLGRCEDSRLSRGWVHVDDPAVSKRHAVVDNLSDVSVIQDISSTNGTVLYVHSDTNYDKRSISLL